MNSISPDEILKISKVLDNALLNHDNWYANVLRCLICRLPLPDDVTAKDAHHHCAFGTWFYGMGQTQVHNLPAFKHLEQQHKAMHDCAREICLKFRTMSEISEVEYDVCRQTLEHFREELNTLRERVSALYQEIKSEQEAEAARKAKEEQQAKHRKKTNRSKKANKKHAAEESGTAQESEPKKAS